MKPIKISLSGSGMEVRDFLREHVTNYNISFVIVNVPHLTEDYFFWLLTSETFSNYYWTGMPISYFNVTATRITYSAQLVAKYTQYDDITYVPDWGDSDLIIDMDDTIKTYEYMKYVHKKSNQRLLFTHYIPDLEIVVYHLPSTPTYDIAEYSSVPDMRSLAACYAYATMIDYIREYKCLYYTAFVPTREYTSISDADLVNDYKSGRSGMLNFSLNSKSNVANIIKVVFQYSFTPCISASEYEVPTTRTLSFVLTVMGTTQIGSKGYVEYSIADFSDEKHPCHGLLEDIQINSVAADAKLKEKMFCFFNDDLAESAPLYVRGVADMYCAHLKHLTHIVMLCRDYKLKGDSVE